MTKQVIVEIGYKHYAMSPAVFERLTRVVEGMLEVRKIHVDKQQGSEWIISSDRQDFISRIEYAEVPLLDDDPF